VFAAETCRRFLYAWFSKQQLCTVFNGSIRSMTHDGIPTSRERIVRSCWVRRWKQASGLLQTVVQVLLL